MRESYYYEFEIENINLLITEERNFFDVRICEFILPLHYRIEFLKDLNYIYSEEELEMNDDLIIKKLLFLLITISTGQGVEGYS